MSKLDTLFGSLFIQSWFTCWSVLRPKMITLLVNIWLRRTYGRNRSKMDATMLKCLSLPSIVWSEWKFFYCAKNDQSPFNKLNHLGKHRNLLSRVRFRAGSWVDLVKIGWQFLDQIAVFFLVDFFSPNHGNQPTVLDFFTEMRKKLLYWKWSSTQIWMMQNIKSN